MKDVDGFKIPESRFREILRSFDKKNTDKEVREIMNKWYFTFGFGQVYANCYTTIEAQNKITARMKMINKCGPKWAFQYDSAEDAGVEEFGLHYVDFDVIDPKLLNFESEKGQNSPPETELGLKSE
jgi:hypothetical protein